MIESQNDNQEKKRNGPVHENAIMNNAFTNEGQNYGPERAQNCVPIAEIDRTAFQVKWDENDSKNPKNWSSYLKLWITFVMGLLAFTGSVGSAITNPAEEALAEYFNISPEVTVLAMSLFILGTSSS